MTAIDWSKAGRRLRRQPFRGSHNPDWNWAQRRWKDEADYYADELDRPAVLAAAPCPTCQAPAGAPCSLQGADYHMPRLRAAGEALLALHGPRFGGEA